jgi:hypothetical protein
MPPGPAQNGEELAAFDMAGPFQDNSELLFNLRALERFFPDLATLIYD